MSSHLGLRNPLNRTDLIEAAINELPSSWSDLVKEGCIPRDLLKSFGARIWNDALKSCEQCTEYAGRLGSYAAMLAAANSRVRELETALRSMLESYGMCVNEVEGVESPLPPFAIDVVKGFFTDAKHCQRVFQGQRDGANLTPR